MPPRLTLLMSLLVACQTPLVIERGDDVRAAGGASAGSAGTLAVGAAGAGGDPDPDALLECDRPLLALTVSAGEQHACAIEYETRALYCWGLGTSGQLGTGDTESSASPRRVQSDEPFLDVRVGTVSTCALTEAHDLFCWGDNFDGVLADGTTQGQSEPVRVVSGARVLAMSAGYVIVTADDGVFSWGSDTHGQLGLGDASVGTTVRSASFVMPPSFGTLAAGYTHACAIESSTGHGYCTGNNFDSRLGIPGGARSTFTSFSDTVLKHVSAGYDRSCALTSLGELECWGNNVPVTFEGLPDVVETPERLGRSDQWSHVSVGFDHLCAADNFGQLFCVGNNDRGQLGRSGPASPSFVRLAPDFPSFVVSAGRGFSCALRTPDAAVVCFGSNENGKLGRGSDDEGRGAPALVCLPP